MLDIKDVPAHLFDAVAVDFRNVLGGGDENNSNEVRHPFKDVSGFPLLKRRRQFLL